MYESWMQNRLKSIEPCALDREVALETMRCHFQPIKFAVLKYKPIKSLYFQCFGFDVSNKFVVKCKNGGQKWSTSKHIKSDNWKHKDLAHYFDSNRLKILQGGCGGWKNIGVEDFYAARAKTGFKSRQSRLYWIFDHI